MSTVDTMEWTLSLEPALGAEPCTKSRSDNSGSEVVPQPAITVDEAMQRIRLLQEFVHVMMVPGEDYGIIPGCGKPSLLKPGAEKLCDIFGFSKQVAIVEQVEEWAKGVFAYTVKVTLVSKRTGMAEAEGLGSCNSRERRYRQQDPFNIANTILKMAKKRALVDAVLSATRASGLFTQDVEDVLPDQPPGASQPRRDEHRRRLSSLFTLVGRLDMDPAEARAVMIERYGVDKSRLLTSEQIGDFVDYLQNKESASN